MAASNIFLAIMMLSYSAFSFGHWCHKQDAFSALTLGWTLMAGTIAILVGIPTP